jgi:dTDP-4-dehydrorhamnose reductase
LAARASRDWAVAALYHTQRDRVTAGEPVQLDLRSQDAVARLFDDRRPDLIIHTAVTERSGDYPAAIPQAAASVAAAANRLGCRLIHMSTDLVFDGLHPPYTEDAPFAPTSPYGKAKAEAEAIVRQTCRDFVIVRTSLIYDFTPENYQLGWMLRKVEQGEVVNLFTDQFRSPVWVRNLSDALLELATLDYTGVLNIAGPQRLSRLDYGRALLGAVGVNVDAFTRPALAAELMPGHAPDATLDVGRAQALLNTPLLTIDEAIRAAGLPLPAR